jgi:hypothetical protein
VALSGRQLTEYFGLVARLKPCQSDSLRPAPPFVALSVMATYLTIQGYIVVCNTKVGKLDHGGWKMELDVVAYCPTRDRVVHYEPSLDANSWKVREERFTKKFSAAQEHLLDIPQFAFLTKADVKNMEQIAIFPSVPKARRDFLGCNAVGVDDLMSEIIEFVTERGRGSKAAFPEQYPLLRTLQFAVCGYYKRPRMP